ncbi:MAG: hypothetical protein FKY71_11855 [Spiribacter salinus]|uniref:Hemerythrin-like domain-containing protein n=1 Tax=Spiribacter salinus TaxID=1335746 RepID=A0A540VPX9_9GAMM|nr:hypothetical protein [Aquisalimonas sp. 2447]QIT54460.1 hypothetical protein HC341_04055 [Aquisalimonas sp. 2447]TQE98812.1 MAG: hypothetical protein FKY71_11855 [Spiribacter salinus]
MEKVKARSADMRLGCNHIEAERNALCELQAARARIIHLLDEQLTRKPSTRSWRQALERLELAVTHQLRLEDDLLREEQLNGYRETDGGVRGLCADIPKLRGLLPQLFHDAREANPDTAFMAYLRLAATLRRWAGCMEGRA